jgi:hypothetical protein
MGVNCQDNDVVDLRTVPSSGEEDKNWFGHRANILAVALIDITKFCS